MARKRTADKQHRWLSQIEVTGVVFSEPVLAEAAPAGFPNLDKRVLARFYKAREIWNLPKGMLKDDGQSDWIRFILEEILRLKNSEDWLVGAAIPAEFVVRLSNQQETLRPNRVLMDDGASAMAFLEVPRGQSLDRPWLQKIGRWKASPTTKLERLLRETKLELGLVTNGEAWRLLVASPSETASWITWTANTWADSPITLAAFRDLLGEERFFAGIREDVVLELVRRSRKRQLDVADQLGAQVREALGLLVHELDRVDAVLEGELVKSYSEAEVFEAVVAFIMRLLFLLFAEENGLLPHGTVAYDRAYGILHLLTELENQHRLAPEKLKHSYSAYARVLATTRLIHAGSVDPDIRVAAHGGQLFDPDRYPMLEGREKDGSWPIESPEPPRVSDAVVREVLRSLKYAKSDGSRQLVSYRTLAVEQIGHMYEGLLDRRVVRAPMDDVLFMLQGSSKVKEPEPLRGAEVEGLEKADLLKLIAKHTGRTRKTLKNLLEKPEDRIRLRDAGTADGGLLARLAPVHRFIVDRGLVRPGGLFVTHGNDRHSQGAHYTPPTLTEPIVRRTLEHQVYVSEIGRPGQITEPRRVRTPEELLSLKVVDPAMGSGAFLVQVVRYLAERLVDAWEVRALESSQLVLVMPFATGSEGGKEEALLPESREDRLVWAKRYVAEWCLFGVDLDRRAVEMAKLSLWIVTASKDLPFTFLRHALKHGDSLIGLSNEQIQAFTWKALNRDWGPLFANISTSISEARAHRARLHGIPEHDFRGKQERLDVADSSVARTRVVADLVLAAFLGASKDKQRESLLREYRGRLERSPEGKTARAELKAYADRIRIGEHPVFPFHWELEFPEVFGRENRGFDAVVGNPPFVTGRAIRGTCGLAYKQLLSQLRPHTHGNADLSAQFFLRTHQILRENGCFGLVATNTIKQGQTRATGLQHLVSGDIQIYDAITDMYWPVPGAAVVVDIVHGCRGNGPIQRRLNGQVVDEINSGLTAGPELPDPAKLPENSGRSFQGSIVLGKGFVLEPAEARGLVDAAPANAEVVLPYIGGEELNSNQPGSNGMVQHSRYVISFFERSIEEAAAYTLPFRIIQERVMAERTRTRPDGSFKLRTPLPQRWWQFADKRPALYRAIRQLERCLVTARVSKHHLFCFQPTTCVFSEQLIVVALDDWFSFSVLQSCVHEAWSRGAGLSSTMKTDTRYTPSSVFETFPFPHPTQAGRSTVVQCGQTFDQQRTLCMRRFDEGMTKVWNRLLDQNEQDLEIETLRQRRAQMDLAVLAAYGWSEVEPQDTASIVTSLRNLNTKRATKKNQRK